MNQCLRMSPTLNGSSALQHFEHDNVVKIRNGIILISTWDYHSHATLWNYRVTKYFNIIIIRLHFVELMLTPSLSLSLSFSLSPSLFPPVLQFAVFPMRPTFAPYPSRTAPLPISAVSWLPPLHLMAGGGERSWGCAPGETSWRSGTSPQRGSYQALRSKGSILLTFCLIF